MDNSISKQTLQRMPYYLQHLREMHAEGKTDVSAPYLADFFGFTEIQVRKDLAAVSSVQGKPKVGFKVTSLIADMEKILGYKNENKAVLVGVGSLGHALLGFTGFSDYGIEIIASFDADKNKTGTVVNGKPVLPMDQLKDFCLKNRIKIGIITVPPVAAQKVCDRLVEAEVKAMWNFAQLHLNVPDGYLVQNENLAASLALLFKHLKETTSGQ